MTIISNPFIVIRDIDVLDRERLTAAGWKFMRTASGGHAEEWVWQGKTEWPSDPHNLTSKPRGKLHQWRDGWLVLKGIRSGERAVLSDRFPLRWKMADDERGSIITDRSASIKCTHSGSDARIELHDDELGYITTVPISGSRHLTSDQTVELSV